MAIVPLAMIAVGLITLLAGLLLARPRITAASGPAKLLALGPVFSATALAIFAAEHFTAARDLSAVVPHWLPYPIFWTRLVGFALLAAALSFIAFRCVRWSASLLALLFLIIVLTIDLPVLPRHLHQRLFWTLTLRELCFAAGALVLAGSVWPHLTQTGSLLTRIGRTTIALIFVFYAAQHFLYPRFVPGVPLENLIPPWFPAPVLLSFFVGSTLLAAAIGLLIPRTRALAAAASGAVLLLLTFLFYVPILLTELHSPLAVEGVNYVGDTLLFAATTLLAGLDPNLFDTKTFAPAAHL